jgi:hypothetical protein
MDKPKPKPSWGKRKRMWVVAALLALGYPLSAGPFLYASVRTEVPEWVDVVYYPAFDTECGPLAWPVVGSYYDNYLVFWLALAGGP